MPAEIDRLKLVDDAWDAKQTHDDLKLLADLHTQPHFPPFKQVLLRLQGKALAQLERVDVPEAFIRQAQGALSCTRELLEFLEVEAPSAYERHLQELSSRAKQRPHDD